MPGKNFSANNTGKRRASDFYQTPYALTDLLLDKIELDRTETILEPASGGGAIVRVLERRGFLVEHYDLEKDFLAEDRHFRTIITNPPFSLSSKFIQKAKEVSDQFFFLLPISYLHGQSRLINVWKDTSFPLKSIFVFSRYPLLEGSIREDGKHKTGMMCYAWYWFCRSFVGKPIIEWLDNNDFVVRKEKKYADS